jgi:hypothetical protein
MDRLRFLIPAVLLVGVGVLVGSVLTRTHAANASSTHHYTLRLGDKVSIPAIGQVCTLATEGTAKNLLCSKPRKARHQVVIFGNDIFVYKVGNPDRPAWAGKP